MTGGNPILRRGVVAVITRASRFLVIRRSWTVSAPGAYCFPGGGIEGDESEPAALIRELREELNIEVQPLERLWRSVTPWGVDLAWWRAELHETAVPLPNPLEVQSVAWLAADEMLALPELLESNRLFLDALRQGKLSGQPPRATTTES